jgi:hypothetical protein
LTKLLPISCEEEDESTVLRLMKDSLLLIQVLLSRKKKRKLQLQEKLRMMMKIRLLEVLGNQQKLYFS